MDVSNVAYMCVLISYRFYFLAVLALMIFRYTEPDLKRPYRVWFSTPVLFCIVALFLCTTPFIEVPVESLMALGFVLLAIPLWMICVYFKDKILITWSSKWQNYKSERRGRDAHKHKKGGGNI